MVLVVFTVAAAFVVGLLRGGRFGNLADAPVRAGVLVAAAAGAQFLSALAPGAGTAMALTALSEVALLTFLWCNRFLAGALLAALGSALNTVVILANGAMPVSADAILAVSRHPAELSEGRHRLLTDTDALPVLADVIALPILRTVVSIGDVVLAAGLALIVIDLMRARPRRSRPSGRQAAGRHA